MQQTLELRFQDSLLVGADLRTVDLSGLTIANVVQQFKDAVLSTEQAAALISGLGVRVM